MKKSSCLLVLAASVALSGTAWSACKPPDSLRKFPDGKTATLDQMKAAKNSVNQFQAKMDSYQACIKDEYETQLKKNPKGDDKLKEQFLEGYKQKDDRAMDEKQKAVAELNAQIAAYKAANPK